MVVFRRSFAAVREGHIKYDFSACKILQRICINYFYAYNLTVKIYRMVG